jgi:uncharacterized RDD family membrane protein YckC
VEYEDRRTIATPEGVDLELPLAGVGTRAIGLFIDSVIQVTVIVIAIVGLSPPAARSPRSSSAPPRCCS